MTTRHDLLLLGLLATALAASAPAAAIPVVRVASGLSSPIYAASPPGDPRLFIVERGGVIRILEGGAILPTAFLDIHERVDTGGEGGLLSIAFAPDYATSRAFYVYYTTDGNPMTSRISRFRANAANPNVADDDPTQEKILLSVNQPETNHKGGTVAFGPDGMLYMGFGDGGGQFDPGERAQDPTTLLGKMIRLDVAFAQFTDDYAIPDDNPFVGPDGIDDEIWAIGFRNPFRFSFDRETGDLYVGDVGQNTTEEIDFEPAGLPGGRNYGWDVMEGTNCVEAPDPGEPPCNDPSLVLPVHEYGHGQGLSVTGGVVYRGSRVPELEGHYLFADYSANKVWSFEPDGVGGIVGDVVDRTSELAPDQGAIGGVVAFGEDADGDVYLVDLGGEVFHVPEPAQGLLAAVGAALLAGARRLAPRRRAEPRS
ncbi:MAG TPA: PQQ-dependent sugar dehydrogenase [Myxococcota bacterium]|nr:PQQ-dependent sugar dehydrogenase [Myxococcota bacterium]